MRRCFLLPLLVLASWTLPGSALLGQYNAETIRGYVDTWWPTAVAQMESHGIPASISLAQGILESGAGTSELTRRANNHFGIKCHKGWTGKSVRYDDDARNECFRSYRDAAESWEDHSEFLTGRSRYASLFDLKPTDYAGWAHGLRRAGYATNPRYADLLIKLIRDYELHQYDRMDTRQVPLAKRNTDRRPPDDVPHRPSAERPSDEVVWFNRIPSVRARPGERPADLARRHDLSLEQLCGYNDVDAGWVFAEGERVFLKPKRRSTHQKQHRVISGESLRAISQQYGIRLDVLAKRNQVNESFVPAPGEFIVLRGKAKTVPKAADRSAREAVQKRLAEHHQKQKQSPPPPANASTSTEDRLNAAPEKGQVDFVPVGGFAGSGDGSTSGNPASQTPTVDAHKPAVEQPAAVQTDPPAARNRTHTVQSGETLYSLSRRYGVSVDDIRIWNSLGDATIKIGQELVVGP